MLLSLNGTRSRRRDQPQQDEGQSAPAAANSSPRTAGGGSKQPVDGQADPEGRAQTRPPPPAALPARRSAGRGGAAGPACRARRGSAAAGLQAGWLPSIFLSITLILPGGGQAIPGTRPYTGRSSATAARSLPIRAWGRRESTRRGWRPCRRSTSAPARAGLQGVGQVGVIGRRRSWRRSRPTGRRCAAGFSSSSLGTTTRIERVRCSSRLSGMGRSKRYSPSFRRGTGRGRCPPGSGRPAA